MAKYDLQQLLNIWIQILDCVIDYTILVIDYQQLINVLIQILKPVIDYTNIVIDYQRRFSENNFQESHLFKWFMNGHQRSIYMWLGNTNLKRVFIAQKVLSSQKIKSFSELKCLILSKRFLGQPLAYSIRNFDWSSLYNLSLSREISSSLLLTSEKGLRDRGSLVVKEF